MERSGTLLRRISPQAVNSYLDVMLGLGVAEVIDKGKGGNGWAKNSGRVVLERVREDCAR
jgi:hypothetical protein